MFVNVTKDRAANNQQDITWNPIEETLHVDWSQTLGFPCELIIHGANQNLKWHSLAYGELNRPSAFEEPGINLFHESDHPGIQQWQATIDPDCLNSVRKFSRWSYSLMRLAYEWSEAKDLMKSNPVLLFMVWNYFQSHKMSMPRLRRLLAKKQTEIMAFLGLHSSKSSVRLLRKLSIDSIGVPELTFVKFVWRRQAMVSQLTHLKSIDLPFLMLLKKFPLLAGSPLAIELNKVECRWEFEEAVQLINDTLRMGSEVQLSRCQTMNGVRRLHDRLVREMNRRPIRVQSILKDEDGNELPFPEPPHSGTDLIRPIINCDELFEEGRTMSHCVGSYAGRVQGGSYFVYRMESPQRLTIGVSVMDGEIIGVDQAKGFRNKAAKAEAVDVINEWLVLVRG